MLSSLVHEHAYLKSLVVGETMPTRQGVATMQKHLGRKKGVQPKVSRKCRIIQATKRRKRRLSPWNVFCRAQLQQIGKGCVLNKDEYKHANRQIAAMWRSMTKEERKPYHIDAVYEQSCRDELATRALPSGRKKSSNSTVIVSELPQPAAAAPQDQPTHLLENIAGTLAQRQYLLVWGRGCCKTLRSSKGQKIHDFPLASES